MHYKVCALFVVLFFTRTGFGSCSSLSPAPTQGRFTITALVAVKTDCRALDGTRMSEEVEGCDITVKAKGKKRALSIYTSGTACKLKVGDIFKANLQGSCCDMPGAIPSCEAIHRDPGGMSDESTICNRHSAYRIGKFTPESNQH